MISLADEYVLSANQHQSSVESHESFPQGAKHNPRSKGAALFGTGSVNLKNMK